MIIGQLLDRRYRVFKVLSSGAFGRTYLAADTRRPGPPQCVVKRLQPPNDNPQLLKTAHRLFKREAETLEKLGKHNQIPQLLAYFQENQQFYLVEEFIPGHPLSKEIVPGKPLSETQAIAIMQEILEILVFVHGQGVIHRDVNPTNIIRRQTDNRLVLIDFGSVKEVSTQILNAQGQMPWTVAAGTPAYMPIEQFQGNPQFNSDIYAVGMIGIQALTGLPGSDLPKLQNPKQQEPDRLNMGRIIWRHRVKTGPDLADVIDKMTHPYFGERYQSTAQVLGDLRRFTANESETPIVELSSPQPIKKVNIEPRQQKPLPRQALQLTLLGVAILGVLSGIVLANRLPQILISQQLVNQGITKGSKGNHKDAIADYNQALAVNSQDATAYYNRGVAHFRLGERQKALLDYTQAIQLNANYAQAYSDRGKVRFGLGDDQGAMEDYNQAIELAPQLAAAYLGRGNVRAQFGNEQLAIEDYTQAIKIDPQLPAAYLNRCLSYSNIGNQRFAIADCTKATQLKPNYAFAYQNRGLARRRIGDFQGAIEDYNVAIRIEPKDADPYYNRGLARFDLGENQGALSDFNQAIQLNPNHALVYYDRGLVRSELKDKQGAIEDFQQSAKLCLDEGRLSCYKDAQYQLAQLQG